MGLLKYTNGIGHLIMSIMFAGVGLALIIYPGLDATARGIGITILTTDLGAWFIPGAAKQVAHQVQQSVDTAASDVAAAQPPPPPAPIPVVVQPPPVPLSDANIQDISNKVAMNLINYQAKSQIAAQPTQLMQSVPKPGYVDVLK